MLILDQYLNESTGIDVTDVQEVEMSNEGFDFELGGGVRALTLSESAISEIDMFLMAQEVKSCKLMSESAVVDAYVLQENVITNALSSIKKVILKLWARMKEVVSSARLYFEKLFSNSAFIKDAEKQLEKMTDFSNLEFEGYNFTVDAIKPSDLYSQGASEVESIYSKAAGELGKVTASEKIEDTHGSVEKSKDALNALKGEELNKSLSEKMFGCEPEKINEEIFKKLRSGKDDKEKITWSKSQCVSAVKNLSSLQNKVKGVEDSININHKKAIKTIDDAISASNKADNSAKDNEKPLTTAKLNALKDKSSAIQVVLNYATKVCNAQLDALKDDCAQSKNHILAAISQGRKNARTASESTIVSESGSILDAILNNY